MITHERLKEIKERCEKASVGPWDIGMAIEGCCWIGVGKIQKYNEAPRDPYNFKVRDYDAPFIAHARTDIPDLVAELEMLQEQQRQDRAWILYVEREIAKLREENNETNAGSAPGPTAAEKRDEAGIPARKIIQILTWAGRSVALCSDGSIWEWDRQVLDVDEPQKGWLGTGKWEFLTDASDMGVAFKNGMS